MRRTFELLMVLAMLAAAFITYTIKYDAEKQISVINKLKQQIAFERDTITLLRADWSLMTQPGRLENLVKVYDEQLKLVSIEPTQIVGFNAIPPRPADDIEKLIDNSDDMLASGATQTDVLRDRMMIDQTKTDKTMTGSIRKKEAGR